MNTFPIRTVLKVSTVIALIGVVVLVTSLIHIEVKPTTSVAQTDTASILKSTHVNYTPCNVYSSTGICERLDRVIEQNDQLISLDAYNFCKKNFDALPPMFYNGSYELSNEGFQFCVIKVLELTK